jgi:hypothetical protein
MVFFLVFFYLICYFCWFWGLKGFFCFLCFYFFMLFNCFCEEGYLFLLLLLFVIGVIHLFFFFFIVCKVFCLLKVFFIWFRGVVHNIKFSFDRLRERRILFEYLYWVRISYVFVVFVLGQFRYEVRIYNLRPYFLVIWEFVRSFF